MRFQISLIGKENTLEENAFVIQLFHIVILSVWTWSLCQFTFVLTTVKKLPKSIKTNEKIVIQQNENNIVDPPMKNKRMLTRSKRQVTETNKNQKKTKDTKYLNSSNAICNTIPNSKTASVSNNVQNNVMVENGNNASNKSEEQSKSSKTSFKNVLNVKEDIAGNYFNCFCFYSSIWGLILGIIFQDIPFLAIRILIISLFNPDEPDLLFFTIKNILVILLIFFKIIAIYQKERKQWLIYMKEIKQRQRKDLHSP